MGRQDADIFAAALVRDERSFYAQNYSEAARILSAPAFLQHRPRAAAVVERLAQLEARLSAACAARKAADADLGELPDDVTDPLLSDLMDDPVLLPVSRQVCQRASIMHQLRVCPRRARWKGMRGEREGAYGQVPSLRDRHH